MAIRIVKAGMLTTIQDLGRFGFQKSGMAVSGAMDQLALQLGNIILRNQEGEAGIECTMMGPTIYFDEDQCIAITGGNLSPNIDGYPVSMWKPLYVSAGSTLSFGQLIAGCRSYICFSGGLDVPLILDSRSTYLQGEIGGWYGRPLQKDDRIPFRQQVHRLQQKATWYIHPAIYPDLSYRTIRITKGPHLELFKDSSIVDLFLTPFSIKNESDRMGYRLRCAPLSLRSPVTLPSAAVTFGTIQVPSQDTAIILMADHPTTGGYPIIAQIVTADLPLLAQLKPQEQINFEFATLAEAQQLLENQRHQLDTLKQSIALKYEYAT